MTNSTELACLRCGTSPLQPGFIEDAAQGKVRWFNGELEFGPMGGLRRMGLERLHVVAMRCPNCGRLELSTHEGPWA